MPILDSLKGFVGTDPIRALRVYGGQVLPVLRGQKEEA
jgi:hypothetical protein